MPFAGADPLAALCVIARLHQVAAEPAALAHQLGLAPSERAGTDDVLRGARHLGLKARLVRTSVERLAHTPLPALALMRAPEHQGPQGEHAPARLAILAQCDGKRVLLSEPAARTDGADAPDAPDVGEPHGIGPTIEPIDVFAARWSGQLILIASHASLVGELARFDFSWFIPALVKYRRLLGEVVLISFMLQLFGLVSPLFFQVVVDKVLTNKGTSTLDVLVIGLVIVVVFESVLSALRSYLFGHTTSRIDVELGARLFTHLLQLPLAYFQARRVGDSVARVRELEHIRGFLTGNALSVVLDVFFSAVFIAVMLLYNVTLTLIVLASLPLYFGLSLAVVPVLRRRLELKFTRGAQNQAMLVEALSAIQTVKAGALEPAFARRWDQQLAAYVLAGFRAQNLASVAHEGVNLIGKLVNAATLWYGAHLVMDNALSVGQFVAFNMFAQRVAQPIMRMAQLWSDFQQSAISMARLGDILDTRTEVPPVSAAQLPRLHGRITLEQLVFRYHSQGAPVLDAISLEIAPGEVIGIVGRSGSGKSTLAKLVQRLYTPQGGRVLVDGIDISLIDAAQLRRQIGVVLQDNVLFNRSVRDNIAIADPGAPLHAVIQAAQLAGAHAFISELAQGYDTLVGEQGSTLSGGQRQRIAIARALFGNPRILILDEATSALDYESEALIQRNLAGICRGRTVLIIAHRLSSVRQCARIIVLERGRIVQAGTHDALLKDPQGLYAQLWALQDGAAALHGAGA